MNGGPQGPPQQAIRISDQPAGCPIAPWDAWDSIGFGVAVAYLAQPNITPATPR